MKEAVVFLIRAHLMSRRLSMVLAAAAVMAAPGLGGSEVAAAQVAGLSFTELRPYEGEFVRAPVVDFHVRTPTDVDQITAVVGYDPQLSLPVRRYDLAVSQQFPFEYSVRVVDTWVAVQGPPRKYYWRLEASKQQPDGTTKQYTTLVRTLKVVPFGPQCSNQLDDDSDGLIDDNDAQCLSGSLEDSTLAALTNGHACQGSQWNGYWTHLSARATTCRIARRVMASYSSAASPNGDDVPPCLQCRTNRRVGSWACTTLVVKDVTNFAGGRVQALRVTCAESWRKRVRFYGVSSGYENF